MNGTDWIIRAETNPKTQASQSLWIDVGYKRVGSSPDTPRYSGSDLTHQIRKSLGCWILHTSHESRFRDFNKKRHVLKMKDGYLINDFRPEHIRPV